MRYRPPQVWREELRGGDEHIDGGPREDLRDMGANIEQENLLCTPKPAVDPVDQHTRRPGMSRSP